MRASLRNISFCIIAIALPVFFAPPLHAGNIDTDRIHTAEVQWTVCSQSHSRLLKLINSRKHLDQYSWQTSFFDTENMDLFKVDGIVMRDRLDSSGHETAFKMNLTPEEFDELNNQKELRGLDCELDAYLDHSKVGCKLKNKSYYAEDKFSDKQKYFLKTFSNVPFSSLRKFGPVRTELLQLDLFASFDDPVSIEIMNLSAKSNWIEVSTRADVEDIDKVNDKMLNWFKQNQIEICHPRISKTEAVLREYQ